MIEQMEELRRRVSNYKLLLVLAKFQFCYLWSNWFSNKSIVIQVWTCKTFEKLSSKFFSKILTHLAGAPSWRYEQAA